MFSVALSLGSPLVAVSDHPALRSSDFPPTKAFAWRAIPRPPSAMVKKGGIWRRGERECFVHYRFAFSPLPLFPLFFYLLIYGFIGQLVSPTVFFPRYTQNTILGEPIQGLPGLLVEGLEVGLSDPVLAPKLADDQF